MALTQDVTAGTQWTLSNSALAKMSNGALTATAPGTVTVQAAYVETTPAGNSPASADTSPEKLSASTQVTITATPSTNTPSITWNAPAAITYGAALSGTQLNATANVPGTCVFPGCRDGAQSGNADAFCSLHSQQQGLCFGHSNGTAFGCAGQPYHQLDCAGRNRIMARRSQHLQLNATANVPGIFVYSPAAGAVLERGTRTLVCGLHSYRHNELFFGHSNGTAFGYTGQSGNHSSS